MHNNVYMVDSRYVKCYAKVNQGKRDTVFAYTNQLSLIYPKSRTSMHEEQLAITCRLGLGNSDNSLACS